MNRDYKQYNKMYKKEDEEIVNSSDGPVENAGQGKPLEDIPIAEVNNKEAETPEIEPEVKETKKEGVVSGSAYVNLRAKPSFENSQVLKVLNKESIVSVIEDADKNNGFYKVKYRDIVGYISKDYLVLR